MTAPPMVSSAALTLKSECDDDGNDSSSSNYKSCCCSSHSPLALESERDDGDGDDSNTNGKQCRSTRGLPATGTGKGKPLGKLGQPVAIPVPPERVWVFKGYGSGYVQKYPRVTRVNH